MWAADSQEYLLFNNWLYNAGFYFMPIFLGWSAAKQLGASPQLGMMLGGVLIAPELMDLVASAAETRGDHHVGVRHTRRSQQLLEHGSAGHLVRPGHVAG